MTSTSDCTRHNQIEQGFLYPEWHAGCEADVQSAVAPYCPSIYFAGRSKHYSHTEQPPKYYYIDLSMSHKQNPNDGPPWELPILGGDKSVPEFQDDGYDDKPSDPFATDIYYLGNLIQKTFFDVHG